ncbi:hypothetical protein [Halalkalicoccus subterraneus]|uniref:hypothetical protein n=1 Tax=Halalkalicoccus subterraneus TaxID=2675002 RepID=UPI000EFD56B0|nr:hypothetical protein [Halalkalicoccus subterraneus]
MIKRQERNIRRDGALFLLGFAGIILVEIAVSSGPVGSDGRVVQGLLFGCSIGILLSGIFRAPTKQALYSTLSLGVGFALGAVIDIV